MIARTLNHHMQLWNDLGAHVFGFHTSGKFITDEFTFIFVDITKLLFWRICFLIKFCNSLFC